jgi:hypothetical protein
MIWVCVFEDQAALYQCRMEEPFHLQSASLLLPVGFKTKFLIFIMIEMMFH